MKKTLPSRIESAYLDELEDPAELEIKKTLKAKGIEPERVKIHTVFFFHGPFAEKDLLQIKSALFNCPTKKTVFNETLEEAGFETVLTIHYKPGVTDNLVNTAQKASEELIGPFGAGQKIQAAKRILFSKIDPEKVQNLLHNPLIEKGVWSSYQKHSESPYFPPLETREEARKTAQKIPLDISDEALLSLSQKMLLALNLEEMQAIQKEKKEITDVELETLAQTWSEHCYHKIFKTEILYKEGDQEELIDSLFSTYIKGLTKKLNKPYLISVFHDNAGIVRISSKYDIVYKIETHNSPSALDPYGGALTGILGVDRDVLGTGLGAEPLAHIKGYCLGEPGFSGDLQGLLHPKRIRDGVHAGVIDGGNQSGIPLMRGFEVFHETFLGKPLVFCGCIGKIPREIRGTPSATKEVFPNDLIVMIGGRVGKDGIHGATFSSIALTDEAPSSAVQIGDPITQKRMTDFLLEARDLGLYRAITDNGAGGLSSSCGEMATLVGGLSIDLEKVPLKYPGLEPWEIFLSESQERMTLAVPEENRKRFLKLAQKRGVEASVIGAFSKEKKLKLFFHEKEQANLDMHFLHEGCPKGRLLAEWKRKTFPEPPQKEENLLAFLETLLKRPNIASKEEKLRQYDHEVKGLGAIKLFTGRSQEVPPDASVMMVDYESKEGIVLSEAVNPYFSEIDTLHMAEAVTDLAYRRILAAGGDVTKISALDNFCWPSPKEDPYKLAQLVRAAKGLYNTCLLYEMPLISGKDSMANDCTKVDPPISILPTLLISALAPIENVENALTMEPKKAGDLIYVLGETKEELGASEAFRALGFTGNAVPVLSKSSKTMYEKLLKTRTLLHSCHAPSLGGLSISFALMVIASKLGCHLKILEKDLFTFLFSESLGRFIVTLPPENQKAFEKVLDVKPIGMVTEETALALNDQKISLATLQKAYRSPL